MPFSDTQRHGFPCLCYWVLQGFVVLLSVKFFISNILAQKNGRVLPFYNGLLFGFYVCSTQLAVFRNSKARFSVPLLLGITRFCRFAVKLKCTVNKFLPQKNGRVLPFYNSFAIRVLRLQHATCRFRGLLPHRT